MEQSRFHSAYQDGFAPWDIDKPQSVFVRLVERGEIQGKVLDAGCGTGENALYLAEQGCEVTGIDFVPMAIERAQEKAKARGVTAHFQVADALQLGQLQQQFDVIIDSGLFHVFNDEQRQQYVQSLSQAVKPGSRVLILCFSTDEPGDHGPRRISEAEIHEAFSQGWNVQEIRSERFEAKQIPNGPAFSPGGPKARLAIIQAKELS